jgi:hypothetical protein
VKFERTPARLARGDYLFNAALGCAGCHSPRDWTVHAIFAFLKALAPLRSEVERVPVPDMKPNPEVTAN